MPIITIYQGASGSGEALAQQVAQILDFRCVSREVLREASERFAIPEAKLNRILEREPNWWERWLENLRPYQIALQAATSLPRSLIILPVGHSANVFVKMISERGSEATA